LIFLWVPVRKNLFLAIPGALTNHELATFKRGIVAFSRRYINQNLYFPDVRNRRQWVSLMAGAFSLRI